MLRTKSHVGCLQLNNAVERHGRYKQDIFNMAAQGRAKKQTGLSDLSLTAQEKLAAVKTKESTISALFLPVFY